MAQQHYLADWLLEERMISPAGLEQALEHQRDTGTTLGMALLELKLVDEPALVDLLARRYKMPKAPDRLHRLGVSLKALSFIPQDLCWQYGIFPFGVDMGANRLQVAIADPADEEARQLLLDLERIDPELYVVGPKALEKAIRKHYLDALVEDTHHGGRRMRFFGYDHITDPGVAPRAKRTTNRENAAVGSAEAAAQRDPGDLTPEPELTSQPEVLVIAAEEPPREPSVEIRVTPHEARETELTPAVGPATPPAKALARLRGRSLRRESEPTPSPAPAATEQARLAARVAALEEAVGQLVTLLASRADPQTAEMLARIRELLRK